MLRCSQLSKNSVHLNSYKDAVLCSCVLPSSRFEGSLARLVSTQVPSLHSWILWRGCGYLGVNISEDLTWTTGIQTQVKKARQRLYHLRQLRKFRVSPAILKTFYSGSVLTQCISVWYGNSYNQDCKALQRVVRLAEHISGSALPSLQDIYLKCCRSRAVKIIKDSNHPGNRLFTLLPSGKRFSSLMAKTERLRRSFFPQAIRFLNSNSVS